MSDLIDLTLFEELTVSHPPCVQEKVALDPSKLVRPSAFVCNEIRSRASQICVSVILREIVSCQNGRRVMTHRRPLELGTPDQQRACSLPSPIWTMLLQLGFAPVEDPSSACWDRQIIRQWMYRASDERQKADALVFSWHVSTHWYALITSLRSSSGMTAMYSSQSGGVCRGVGM